MPTDIVSHAVEEFNTTYKCNVESKEYSEDYIRKLMRKYRNWSLSKVWYCCNGLYKMCWQDVYQKGYWSMSNKAVKNMILSNLIVETKKLQTNLRFYAEEKDDKVMILVVLRDTDTRADYGIMGTKTK